MTDGKAGEHEYQIAQAPRNQHQPQEERHVIRTGQDVEDAEPDVLEETGIVQLPVAGGGVDYLLSFGEQLLDEPAAAGLDLRKRNVRGHQFEEG